ncbi:MAG: hypothetical protein H0W18_15310 [Acidobacteria bacterium]|nr:hypothetical protein [Acidobacteriota bacterium]
MHALRSALITLALVGASSTALAQPPPKRLLEQAPGQLKQTRGASVAATRHALTRVDTEALAFDHLELTLFDDVRVTARRTSRSHARTGSTVWHGTLEAPDRGEMTLAIVDGALAGNVTVDGRTFEIGFAGGGLHEVREVNHALFPTEDPPVEPFDRFSSSGASGSSSDAAADTAGQIDVMVVWTPAARNAVGGTTAAIQSVVDLAVANANVSYSNSQIATSLRLVYSGEVSFAETPSSISTDLSRFSGASDGYIDQVHTLRNQYAADIVTLIGSGYAAAGYCGVGYLMSSVSTNFASSAFNVVDQSCAGGYLSYAHEVGHNQGLHHDPANAGSTPSYPYAYGFQDPSGAFRTVMSYGGATRVQQFSNPNVLYADRPTGTSAQDNARALNNNAATIANFRSASETTPCSYSVSPPSISFTETSGTATIDVTTSAGCSWTTAAGATWVTVGPGGSGPGSVVVTVAANTAAARSTTVTVAGKPVSISQAGPTPTCSYSVSPLSSTVPSTAATVQVQVTTAAGCAWTAHSNTGWLKASGGGSGSGVATLQVGAASGKSRTATATIAGQTVTVTQQAASKNR